MLSNKAIENIKMFLLCVVCFLGITSGIWAINCAFLSGKAFYIVTGVISIIFQLYAWVKIGNIKLKTQIENTGNTSTSYAGGGISHHETDVDNNDVVIDYDTEDQQKEE